MNNNSYTEYHNESEEEYLWKLGQAKDNGLIDLEWTEIADLMNKQFREDETQYRTEAAYRKPYQQAKKFYECGVFSKFNEDEYIKELKEVKDSVYKEKRKLYDQRREYNKLLTEDARAEHLNDMILESVHEINNNAPLNGFNTTIENNAVKEGLLCFADWHYGMVTDNIWNKFNTEICKQRINTTVALTKDFIRANELSTLHILVLGDSAHGGIHFGCRVASEEKVCDQIMHSTELLAEAVNSLSEVVNEVKVYCCYGNHLRTIQIKQDSVHSDNMEQLVPWYLKARLQNNSKVNIVTSEYKEFTKINILGKNIVAVHGDLDNFKNLGTTVNMIFTKKFGENIDYTISADKHHLEEFEQFGVESTLVRSLCGVDDYANEHRLFSKAGQTFMVFNSIYGKESVYNIPLE